MQDITAAIRMHNLKKLLWEERQINPLQAITLITE